jgi:hypothetical protein
VQRAAVAAGFELGLRAARLLERPLACERDDGVELAADRVEPVQRLLRERDGRDAPGAKIRRQLANRPKCDAHGSAR